MLNNIIFTVSQTNTRMVIYQDYASYFKNIKDEENVWRCKNKSCSAKLKSNSNYELKSVAEHNQTSNRDDWKKILYI